MHYTLRFRWCLSLCRARKILEIIPTQSVQRVTVNFEHALWCAFRKEMPDVEVKGCAFHWTQAVWRKVQLLGLQTAYTDDKAINSFVRRLMALPFYPMKPSR